MFDNFFKKKKLKTLYKEYANLQHKAFKKSMSSRRESDLLYEQADNIYKNILALKKSIQ